MAASDHSREMDLPKRSGDDCHGDVTFSPPLYQQRHSVIIEIVRKNQANKVVDMGCGECQLLRKIKRESTIEHLIGVDVDVSCLEGSKFIINPLITEYLHPVRKKPMIVQLYEGSVADYDDRLSGADVVAFVEVIEHLHPEVLEKVPETLFGLMKPQTVVITTPNSEFNVLFNNFEGFRHWDHKFEWTRQEFQSWCEKVTSQYPYTVTYSGVGLGPPGKEHLGYCTQIAEFIRKQSKGKKNLSVLKDAEQRQPYKLISEAIHPFRDSRHLDITEQILYEVQYYNRTLASSLFQETDEDIVFVSLEKLIQFQSISEMCSDVDKLRKIIKTSETMRLNADETAIKIFREYSGSEMSSDDGDNLETECRENETFGEEVINEQLEYWD